MAQFGSLIVKPAIKRIKELLGLKTDNELREYFGVGENTINMWKYRGTLDITLIYEKIPGVSFDWVLYGKGEPIAVRPDASALLQLKSKLTQNLYNILSSHNVIGDDQEEYITNSDEYYQPKKRLKKRERIDIPILYNSLEKTDTYEVYDEIKGWYDPFHLFNEYTIVIYINKKIDGILKLQEGDNIVVITNRETKNNDIVLVSISDKYEFMRYIKDKTGEYFKSLETKTETIVKYDGRYNVEGVAIARIKKLTE